MRKLKKYFTFAVQKFAFAVPKKEQSILLNSGLFWPDFYRSQIGSNENENSLINRFLDKNAKKLKPNPFFDPVFYLNQYSDVRISGQNPLIHYIMHGESEGRFPIEFFSPIWYRNLHPSWIETDAVYKTALFHYINRPDRRICAPNDIFDPLYYEHNNNDVKMAGVEPTIHFYSFGWKEGRRPSVNFDPAFYRRTYMRGISDHVNPVTYHLLFGQSQGNKTKSNISALQTVFSDLEKFVNPSPKFELKSFIVERQTEVKALAFYLPQFHRFPENDKWWGEGFTEWTNISKGLPRFKDHYQPRVPRDLGFYDLSDINSIKSQVELAKNSGLHGFCFYYYNFNNKRIMETPIELFMQANFKFPFCILWANENWTRRWDGLETDVLIAQDYLIENEEELLNDFVRHFTHPSYIHVAGRPLFIIYRPSLIPDTAETISRWRNLMRAKGSNPLIMMAQGFGFENPEEFGCDGAIEFAPHKVAAGLSPVLAENFDDNFTGAVIRYDDVCVQSVSMPMPAFPLMRGVMPSWDNDVRRQGKGSTVFHGSTPTKYQRWLKQIAEQARNHPTWGESFVFINAWNEWAEGAYLEPDLHFGAAYLNSTARALTNIQDKIAVVIHAFYPEILTEILNHLIACPMQFDLFITCNKEKFARNKKIVTSFGINCEFEICENRGRDILPFLCVLSNLRSGGYTHVLKLHTKKSLHRVDGNDWRARMLDSLLSPAACFNALSALADNTGVGIVAPQDMVVSLTEYWGSNKMNVMGLFERLNISFRDVDSYFFVAGSMFYARIDALIPILNLELQAEDFETEDGQVDGTLAHAVERFISVSATSVGKRVVELKNDTTRGWDIYEYEAGKPSRFEYAEKTEVDTSGK